MLLSLDILLKNIEKKGHFCRFLFINRINCFLLVFNFSFSYIISKNISLFFINFALVFFVLAGFFFLLLQLHFSPYIFLFIFSDFFWGGLLFFMSIWPFLHLFHSHVFIVHSSFFCNDFCIGCYFLLYFFSIILFRGFFIFYDFYCFYFSIGFIFLYFQWNFILLYGFLFFLFFDL